MGFCRRCGDIVAGVRCKCGGTAVAPVVPWNNSNAEDKPQDRWSKTYVQRARSVSPTRPLTVQTTGPPPSGAPSSPTKRFPRPISHHASSVPALGNRVSSHIAAATSQSARPPSPLKNSNTLPYPESDILPSIIPRDTTLSKVYGSVLQPKESLTTHSCAICSFPFPPDATIYPDPSAPNTSRFLCRPCFEGNGGTKGICPTCSRPVLTLKSEGGFIHAAAKYWHKQCFNCSGCFKNIGDSPMVDLVGQPSCAECFENCLKRDPSTPQKVLSTSTSRSPNVERVKNIGGMGSSSKNLPMREGSPAIEELEQRLGITRSREGSPALEDLSHRLTMMAGSKNAMPDSSPTTRRYTSHQSIERPRVIGDYRSVDVTSPIRRHERVRSPELIDTRASPARFASGSPSPVRRQATGSPVLNIEAIEEMKQRFMKGSSHSPGPKPQTPAESPSMRTTAPLRLSRSSASLNSSPKIPMLNYYNEPVSPQSPSIPPTPDLMSDFSDTMTQSSFSGPDSPPRNDEGVGDIFNVSKAYGTGYGSRYTRGDFLDGSEGIIVEETTSELGTPTRTPNSTRLSITPVSTPSKKPTSLTSPSSSIKPKVLRSSIPEPRQIRSPSPTPSELPTSSSCASCGLSLFSIREGGKFVTVPGEDINAPPMTYHVDCFRCTICKGVFNEAARGQAVFVKANGGACHVECAPPTKITIRKVPSLGSLNTSPRNTPHTPAASNSVRKPLSQTSSSRLDRTQVSAPTPATTSFPRFGSRTACPGCNKSVSPMEQGVVPGPQGTRWHASCLVCGGKKEPARAWGIWMGREEKLKGEPGCGKRLDSAAKVAPEGGVWCRECSLLLGLGAPPQTSPTRGPLVPSHTGSTKIAPQFTGTTTLARQFTGLSGGDPALLRQLTGGGLSPTRSISPTKQLGGRGMRPRPKSVIGMRSTKSVDEGRGMFLVRQLTGAGPAG
ncbi:hypothetical protein Hypma_015389 [Hypsizygus marmoreus]|uniref:LIM zinc-binding domain-containing protein n=1 Tax=Hypsizygus marmoreus TaxID=39966 RepID=A0A369K2P6_HYPMA|nr:hypothetical protein Hypma_015389 [Hypsizygus marmoreus]